MTTKETKAKVIEMIINTEESINKLRTGEAYAPNDLLARRNYYKPSHWTLAELNDIYQKRVNELFKEKQKAKTVWVITAGGIANKVYETRDRAKEFMERWRNNLHESGIFEYVSPVDAVYYEVISFETKNRRGEVTKFYAREWPLE